MTLPQPLLFLIALLLFNTAIALVTSTVTQGFGFSIHLLVSQCIGCSVALTMCTLRRRLEPGLRRWLAMFFGLPVSVAIGISLALLLARLFFSAAETQVLNSVLLEILSIGCIFGLIGSTGFLLAERLTAVDRELRQKQLEEVERERRELLVHLKMLQAQIEPHFLFNTLANVAGLIEVEPLQARELLERLISWLRQALVRARTDNSVLGDELDLLENWLQILSLRFGSRLSWQFNVPSEARQLAFPPMLLQPLLENAIRHGIEPKLGGGSLQVIALLEGQRLRLEVRDDGVGIGDQDLNKAGTGLENVVARLQALYGSKANLALTNNKDGGVTAVLEIPCAP